MNTVLPLAALPNKARSIRREIIRMVSAAGSGHPGGSLSAVEIVTALYFHIMRHDPERPDLPERDRFILSKGHAAPVLYAALAECGYFAKDELSTLRRLGGRLQGHPKRQAVPGVEMSTGSLGQGLAIANGLALAGRLSRQEYDVYVLLGDGELQEGSVWEAAMAAAHYKLDNVIAFVDHNGLQIDGAIKEVMSPEPIADKFQAFGWHVICVDGHEFDQILSAAREAKQTKGKPTVIVAKTVKGKGISFMENQVGWHGTAPNAEQACRALEELMDEGVRALWTK